MNSPSGTQPMPGRFPDFCCPQCKGPLDSDLAQYFCPACRRNYPVVMGIPDFRLFPDSYIAIEDDYQKARRIVEAAERQKLDFEGWVRLYWSITPEVAPDQAERFTRRVLALVEKGRHNLETIARLDAQAGRSPPQRILEIGCGTGGFLAAARGQATQVVGVDIAFRWLVIARQRFKELGLEIPVVCACAEYLPFKGSEFDLIVGENVLEHVREQPRTLDECRRVLRPGGALFLVTPNRFFLGREPHVRLWGVGFLPRRWMDSYVHWLKSTRYRFLCPVSVFELKRLLDRASFEARVIFLPSVTPAEYQNYSRFERLQIRAYEKMKRITPIRWFLYWFGPVFHVYCTAPDSPSKKTS